MTEHTPLPWLAKGPGRLEIYGPGDEWCASCHPAYKHTRAAGNAELIVKAVNAYGPLVATVKNVAGLCTDRTMRQMARQALKDIGEDPTTHEASSGETTP